MKTILTLTMNPTIDADSSVDQVVANRKLRCGELRREPGGGGLNVSRAIKKLGGESLALYTSGGPTGKVLEGLLGGEGVKHRPIAIADWTRENLTILEESANRQFRFVMPGPKLTAKEGEASLQVLREMDPAPDYLVASGSLPRGVEDDFYARAVRICKERRVRVIVDTSGPALRLAAEEGVYLLKPNRRELCQLAGAESLDVAELELAAGKLVKEGRAETVLLSLGPSGALMASREGMNMIHSPAVPFRSAIGAGDSMVAGFVLSLARDWTLNEAAVYGVAAGAAAVMTPGTELCRKEDTERLYQTMKKGSY